ncbi:MAG: UDP-N-acetylmuramate--alanine ligase [Actinomycetota bacterium]|nr:UDP-N-acetylmuramate--alanine ligase [Actinomycetota bacterium]
MPALDLSTSQRIHVIAAGGKAMNAIVRILRAMGHDVSGCDTAASKVTASLEALGVDVRLGHDASHVTDVDVVVRSTAVRDDNVEVVAARAAGTPVLSRAEAMSAICAGRRTVGVSGTHGKTTTTAMLALALKEAGMDPSFLVGGEVTGLGSGTTWSDGEWFVVEADESDATFLALGSEAVIVTNAEADHLALWGTWDKLRDGFERFLADAPGPRVVCADDPEAAALAAEVGGCTTYGTSDDADHRIVDCRTHRFGVQFTIEGLGEVELPLPGIHNARNATAAAVMAVALGAPFDAVTRALATFPGVGQRFELRGDAAGVTFVDSYDHMPTEVAAALAAARDGGWDRIVCVFEPHRYTRTRDVHRLFADSFVDADLLGVTDVYPASETPIPGVTGKLVVDAVLDAHPWAHVAYLPSRAGVVAWLRHHLRPGDLCLTLGAGDLTTLPDQMIELLRG